MQSTRIRYLLGVAAVTALAAWMLTRAFYGDMIAVSVALPLTILVVAGVVGLLGLYVRRAIKDRRIGQDSSQLHPLVAVRILALGTASAWCGATLGGGYVGIGAFVWTHAHVLSAAQADSPAVIVGVVACVVLSAAGLWVEHCCSAPPPSDDEPAGGMVSPA